MTRTYTKDDVLTLPGDTAGLLDGYCGPLVVTTDTAASVRALAVDLDGGDAVIGHFGDCVFRAFPPQPADTYLPLSRPEALYRALCWLAEGARCPYDAHGPGAPYCEDCNATGYLRAPAPLWWALPGPSTLPGWVCRAVVHASVLRVATGQGAVAGVDTSEWRRSAREQDWSTRGCGDIPLRVVTPTGWRYFGAGNPLATASRSGPETGDAGMVAADAGALSAGYALVNGDTLTVEVPGTEPGEGAP